MSIDTFLRQRAVKIAVSGNYTLANWYDAQGKLRNFACRTNRVSPFRMMVDVPVVGKVGDAVTSYFSDFGKFDGVVVDTADGSFLIELEMTPLMREKMSNQLTWLERKLQDPSVKDARRDARIIPASPHSTLTMGDGSVHGCFVIDMSISGVAVSAEVQPPIGTPLAIGACVGRVVRLLRHGFAIQFVEQQKLRDLDWLIARSAPLSRGPQLIADPAPLFAIEQRNVEYIEI